ncbi:MAG: DUF4340 domain-containing protein [Verrucomicrobia bacterium]|nr:DUF4340 domain-containing protein [Verrucomicrobiota bacterium]
MNKNQLTLIIILALVLGGAGLYVLRNRQSSFTERDPQMGEKLLKDYDINTVAAVRIQSSSNAVNLAKTGDTWTVAERNGYPANFGSLKDFLAKLWELKITKPVRVGPSRLAPLQLVAPAKGPGTLIELKDSSGKTTKTLLLGAQHMRESTGESPMGMGMDSSWPDGRYVMVDNRIETVALVSDPLSQAEPRAQNWISKDWFKIEKAKSIAVVSTNAANNFKLTRDSETATWKLADPKPGEDLDSTKSSSVTSAMSYPSFNDVATNDAPAETGLDKPLLATIETFDHFTYTFKIGNKTDDDNYHLQLAVAGSFPKERTPPADEKPEDKEKKDKEFAENLKKLEDKLKTEQASEKWVYLVSKYTIDPFLKTRGELLAEKKPDDKKDEPKTGTPTAATPTPAPSPAAPVTSPPAPPPSASPGLPPVPTTNAPAPAGPRATAPASAPKIDAKVAPPPPKETVTPAVNIEPVPFPETPKSTNAPVPAKATNAPAPAAKPAPGAK